MPHPGDLLGDRYRLDDRIASGGMGEVWQATDTVLGRDVAVKTLHAGPASDTGFRTRFRNEARAMAVLHHPGVADVYDYGQQGTDAYIVMARVHGEPLNQRLADRGRLTPAETMSVVVQAGLALEAAHEAGIVHRDVKPGNLIVQPDGTVILVDFGVARAADSPTLTGAKEVVGTALYIAPEQLSKRTTGPAADLYALGAVAYHCLAGHPPFVGPNPVAVAMMHLTDEPPPLPEDVPADVRALVTRAMAKEPADRFPSAAAMAGAAEEILATAAPDEPALPRTMTTAVLAAAPVSPAVTTPALSSPAPAGAAPTSPALTSPDLTSPDLTSPAAPAGSETAPLPGLPVEGRRKRAVLLAVLALLILGASAAVLASLELGGNRGTPAPAVSPSVKPSTSRSPAATRGGGGPATTTHRPSPTTTAPTTPASTAPTSPAPTRAATTTPAPSRTPTAEPTTPAPEETETATAPASDGEAG